MWSGNAVSATLSHFPHNDRKLTIQQTPALLGIPSRVCQLWGRLAWPVGNITVLSLCAPDTIPLIFLESLSLVLVLLVGCWTPEGTLQSTPAAPWGPERCGCLPALGSPPWAPSHFPSLAGWARPFISGHLYVRGYCHVLPISTATEFLILRIQSIFFSGRKLTLIPVTP